MRRSMRRSGGERAARTAATRRISLGRAPRCRDPWVRPPPPARSRPSRDRGRARGSSRARAARRAGSTDCIPLICQVPSRLAAMSHLFSPLALRSVTLPNRVLVSPMCQYSSVDGMPNEWHFVHLGSRAVGGAGMVCVEAAGVTPAGRITPWDAGIWSEAHARAWKPVADFVRAQGSVPAIQIAHAGRKASCNKPWLGGKPLAPGEGAWETLGPSAVAFGHYPPPRAMTVAEIRATV